jgi:hypothetical protein
MVGAAADFITNSVCRRRRRRFPMLEQLLLLQRMITGSLVE